MKNVYEIKPTKIIKVIKENEITNTLYLKLKEQKNFQFLSGQFMQIGLPGFGECPISISSNSKNASKYFSLTIRAVGDLTSALNKLKVGDTAFVRGPFGNGFPVIDKNLILISGGCGIIPLGSAYEEYKNQKNTKIQIFAGFKNENDLLFKRKYNQIKKKHQLNIILEESGLKGFTQQKGFITDLIKKRKLLKNAKVLVCGPDVMYKFVAKELLAKGIQPKDIYFSLEKRMHCGVGVCQHCAIGTRYVCKDGPVFDYTFLNKHNYFG